MNHLFRRLVVQRFCIVLMVFLTFVVSGCDFTPSNDFPPISYSKASSDGAVSAISGGGDDIASGTLKVALPLSSECIRYLTYMYVGERAGLFRNTQVSESGLTVPLDILDQYNVGLNTVLQVTGTRGLSEQDLLVLEQSNSLPDIFLVNDLRVLRNIGFLPADISGPEMDRYLTPDVVYPTFFPDRILDDPVQSIPFYASVRMIYANRTLFRNATDVDSSTLRSPLSLQTVQTLSSKMTDAENGVFGFMGFSDLLAHLPSSTNPFPKSYLWDGDAFDFRNKAFADSIDALRKFAAEQSSGDALTDAQRTALYGSNDPRTQNRIAFWTDDSDAISVWSNYAEVERYPLPVTDRISVPLKIYSIVVNGNSPILRDAVRLALYIAMDRDALLFRSRYPLIEGYVPPLRDALVWERLVALQKQGSELASLRTVMENSHSIDGTHAALVSGTFDKLYDEFFYDMLFRTSKLDAQMEKIESRAEALMSGG